MLRKATEESLEHERAKIGLAMALEVSGGLKNANKF